MLLVPLGEPRSTGGEMQRGVNRGVNSDERGHGRPLGCAFSAREACRGAGTPGGVDRSAPDPVRSAPETAQTAQNGPNGPPLAGGGLREPEGRLVGRVRRVFGTRVLIGGTDVGSLKDCIIAFDLQW